MRYAEAASYGEQDRQKTVRVPVEKVHACMQGFSAEASELRLGYGPEQIELVGPQGTLRFRLAETSYCEGDVLRWDYRLTQEAKDNLPECYSRLVLTLFND